MVRTMGERVWDVPVARFVDVWNASDSLDAVAARLRELAGGAVPRWSVMARAAALRKDGHELKPLPSR